MKNRILVAIVAFMGLTLGTSAAQAYCAQDTTSFGDCIIEICYSEGSLEYVKSCNYDDGGGSYTWCKDKVDGFDDWFALLDRNSMVNCQSGSWGGSGGDEDVLN
jgi:hypothetical protein